MALVSDDLDVDDINEIVYRTNSTNYCACGCAGVIPWLTKRGTPQTHMRGHGRKGKGTGRKPVAPHLQRRVVAISLNASQYAAIASAALAARMSPGQLIKQRLFRSKAV